MGRPLKKWPTYALDSLEATLYKLKEIERDARAVCTAIDEDDAKTALILLGDVRVKSRECIEQLVRARTGDYEKPERPQWDTPKEAHTVEASPYGSRK